MAIAAIRAGTPELQCKTYEEFERLLKAAAESVVCTTSALPRVLAKTSFGTVPKRKEGNLIRNPAYDEEEFKTLPKKQQTIQRKRSKYLQGPNGSLRALERSHWWLLINSERRTLLTSIDTGSLSLSGSYNLDVATFQSPS